jgi:hypothetical protein
MILLKENEIRKITLANQKVEMQNNDYKSCLDMQRIMDQVEKERNDYFKIRERKTGEANQKAIETVVKGMIDENIREDEAIKKFEAERDKR